MNINTYHFSIATSTDVDKTIHDIIPYADTHMLIHIASYMHNTVMIHNLCSELEKKFPNVEIIHLPAPKDAVTLITLYTYSDEIAQTIKEKELSLPHLILNQLHQEKIELESQLTSTKDELYKRYFTDTLTGLANIYQLREDLNDEEDSTLIILSVDNFKIINDFYGYVVGDYLLEQLSKKLRKELDNTTIYRISGSQFAIRIHQSFDFYSLKSYLTTLAEHLKHLSFTYAQTIIYLDLTFASIETKDRTDIFSKVSMALQYARNVNQDFWIYENRMHFERLYESNLKTSLHIRKAILNEGIVLYFQPILCNKTDKVVKFESLARLLDSEGNILAPDKFLNIAKTIKVYPQVTKAIINKTFASFRNNELAFSINISIEDIMDNDIYEFILEKLKTSEKANQVIFEILESEHIDNFDKISRFITEVKRYGAKIAIDDFGSGYSNFSYLTKLHVDFIKIDGSLIENIDSDPTAAMIVETIVDFAKKLNIETVAEHVHSSTILDKVKQMGIDYSQGFLIDKPHPDLEI